MDLLQINLYNFFNVQRRNRHLIKSILIKILFLYFTVLIIKYLYFF